MKNWYKVVLIFIVIASMGAFLLINKLGLVSGTIKQYYNNSSEVVNEEVVNLLGDKQIEQIKILIVYDDKDDLSTRYRSQLERNFDYMKLKCDVILANEITADILNEYDTVINIVAEVEEHLGGRVEALLDYANAGGKLLWGITFGGHSKEWAPLYNQLGMKAINGFVTINGFKYLEDIMPGSKGMSFVDTESFEDVCLDVELTDDVKVYMTSAGMTEDVPLLWEKQMGEGKVVYYNATSIGGGNTGGVFAGIFSILQGDIIYPIINSKVIYIDDFPAPQYDIEHPILQETYKTTLPQFYRDMWWPDMKKAAEKYGYDYTCLYIANYNNIVNPDKFVMEEQPLAKYYGNSILKIGSEIGLHGYNHQSLALDGFIDESVGYNPWASQEDMEKSLVALHDHAEELFHVVDFETYVPPSNYLSPEGRKALRNALPDLRIISGLYKKDNEEDKAVYVQEFEVADDGIVEFPRMTSGMFFNDVIRFEYLNGLGLHGVFSHFIHPDDIVDEERGANQTWEYLFDGYCKILEEVNQLYPGLRGLRSVEAADAVEVYDALVPEIKYGENKITGNCYNFKGQAFFYLRTEKVPEILDGSCQLTQLSGDNYYLVTVNKPQFTINLNNIADIQTLSNDDISAEETAKPEELMDIEG